MDYEAVKAGLAQAIPFNRHIGLELVEVSDGKGVVRLPDEEGLRNHVGSQHAGGLFAAGEFASGGAVIGALAEHMGGITPLAKGAEIRYLKLAKGPITATGTLGEDSSTLLSKVEAEGRVEFPVTVEMQDGEGQKVAEMTVHWHLRRN
jgi:acyl-coenzyme A thioesterase PaaI-like protein